MLDALWNHALYQLWCYGMFFLAAAGLCVAVALDGRKR
jgi:hypothetical protein